MKTSVASRPVKARRLESAQASLSFLPQPFAADLNILHPGSRRAIEDQAFPFEALSDIAEMESWRKEIYRPLSHIHKWWAQRLGTVFRAICIAAFAPPGTNILESIHARIRIPGVTIFDPFMGSGTTIVEALKLGARAIGRDINPVAYFMVRNALARHDRPAILRCFREIKRDVSATLKRFYQTTLESGETAEVLYYFWVKTVACPQCKSLVDLFPSFIFAQHAYPKRNPEAQAVCPACGAINATHIEAVNVACHGCRGVFNPQSGPAKGVKAECPACAETFPIAGTVRDSGNVPTHRMYAKLALMPDGGKAYLRVTPQDIELYSDAERQLARRDHAYPVVAIAPGYNTNQAIGYNYRHWHEMFNARQLLALSILGERIAAIPDPVVRDLFVCLFSGTLEFNNMFASYKGEGTGAVRHMFAHHILKPERTPLEANLWGTPKSSGSFSTLFESRIARALDYAEDPFELQLVKQAGRNVGRKLFGLSEPLGYDVAEDIRAFKTGTRVYLSCGASSETDIPAGTVDAVITDPPFFDNVHYSQLADFFYVWQRHILRANNLPENYSTRSEDEVQHSDAVTFTERLQAVWRECSRVLKNDGLLVFTYHHSRAEGWECILKALMDTGFFIVAAHPIKSEMSVAMPKWQAKEPINLDTILVCRKRIDTQLACPHPTPLPLVEEIGRHQIRRLQSSGRSLSRNDVRVIVMAQTVRRLTQSASSDVALAEFARLNGTVEAIIASLYHMAHSDRSISASPSRTDN